MPCPWESDFLSGRITDWSETAVREKGPKLGFGSATEGYNRDNLYREVPYVQVPTALAQLFINFCLLYHRMCQFLIELFFIYFIR